MARFIIEETEDYYTPIAIIDTYQTEIMSGNEPRPLVLAYCYCDREDAEFIIEALNGYYEHDYKIDLGTKPITSKEEN